MAAAVANCSDPDSVPKETCFQIAEILRNPLYRTAQIVNLVESVAAFLLIVFCLCRYRRKITIHQNIEILLATLFLACLCHAAVYSVSKVYQLTLSFFVEDPCHLFLPRPFYIVTHTLIASSNLCTQIIQVMMIIERIVATVRVDTYETQCPLLGAMLVTALLLSTMFLTAGESNHTFANFLMTNSLMTTDSSIEKVSTAFAVIFVASCISLLINISLYYYNSRHRKWPTLSSRYQALENASISAMLCVISTVQLTTIAIYAFSMTYLRLKLHHDPMYDPYKECFYMVPLCTLILPVATIAFIERSKRKRSQGIKSLVKMKASGQEGWKNYSAQLKQQWESFLPRTA
ncbi:Integral membrane protein Srb [Trichostrongylus colubriformis]|uniref:Integral membrane protein Srb n=1 Tax=Trichostrongylus colubriformis TaxID=6319 RepID=A0AAN8ESM3_TRICO